MLKYLVDEGLYESKDDTMRREEVLGRIDQVTQRVSLIVCSVYLQVLSFDGCANWVSELTRIKLLCL